MNVDIGLLGYLPLPVLPFNKEQTLPNNKERIVEETYRSVKEKQKTTNMKRPMHITHIINLNTKQDK